MSTFNSGLYINNSKDKVRGEVECMGDLRQDKGVLLWATRAVVQGILLIMEVGKLSQGLHKHIRA
jgi:hypothetical protein